MEKIKYTNDLHEIAYLTQWLSHGFSEDEEYREKKARLDFLKKKNSPNQWDIKPYNVEVGRTRAGVLQHIVRELFSIPQRIAIDREIYRRLEGRPTQNFKYLLMPPLHDNIILAAKLLAEKTIQKIKDQDSPQNIDILKTEILSFVRSMPPQAMIKEILSEKKPSDLGEVVTVEHIMKTCYKHYPDFPFN